MQGYSETSSKMRSKVETAKFETEQAIARCPVLLSERGGQNDVDQPRNPSSTGVATQAALSRNTDPNLTAKRCLLVKQTSKTIVIWQIIYIDDEQG